MGTQRAAVTLATLTIAALALTGCVPALPEPPPPSQEEVDAQRLIEAQTWWDSMATGTTMPDVEVIAELSLEEASSRQVQCLDDANLPGVTVSDANGWSYDGSVADDPDGVSAQVQWWICVQQYPLAADDMWMMGTGQLEWLYAYYSERYLPCLRLVGFEPLDLPPLDEFMNSGTFPSWLPYEATVSPAPNKLEWELIAKRCPLPEMLERYGLPGYVGQPPN